ncbi:MAG: hypothetical protein ACOYJA_12710 [Christensenellales bacterium]|jgi:hypothetical protein
MVKSNYRDYAVSAFRFFAEVGSSRAYRETILAGVAQTSADGPAAKGYGSPTEAQVMRDEAALDNARAELADLEAVERTLDRIDRLPEAVTTRKVLRMVYMDRPGEPFEPGDVSDRIVRASRECMMSEASVYRLLARARRFFAEERGLRIS